MAEYGYDQRGRYLRDAAAGRIQDEYDPSTPTRARARLLGPPTAARTTGQPRLGRADERRHGSASGARAPTLAESIRDQLPKDCPDADAVAVVAITEFLRDEPEQWASPQEIRDAVHGKHHAGKGNPEWWKKMAEWLGHADEVDRVHQRRVEWAGPGTEDGDTGGVYDPTEEFSPHV